MHGSLEKGTKNRYQTNGDLWDAFTRQTDLDPLLEGLPKEAKRRAIVDFIRFLKEEKKINGAEVTRVMTAVRSRFVENCMDVDMIDKDASVLRARKASKELTQREVHIAREKRRRMPVTMDMIAEARRRLWAGSVEEKMTYLAIVLAFNFMWRISEYVMDAKSEEHALRAEDVLFLRGEGLDPVRAWGVRDMKTRERQEVVSILFVVRSSKAKTGRYLYLSRNSVVESQTVDDVISWAGMADINRGDPFLSRWGMGRNKQLGRLKLTRRMVNEELRVMARHAGFDSVGFAFSSHSLRIGGATTMVAGEKSTRNVQRVGGWAEGSSCNEIYELNTPMEAGALSVGGSQFKVLSAKDVKTLLPPSFWKE